MEASPSMGPMSPVRSRLMCSRATKCVAVKRISQHGFEPCLTLFIVSVSTRPQQRVAETKGQLQLMPWGC